MHIQKIVPIIFMLNIVSFARIGRIRDTALSEAIQLNNTVDFLSTSGGLNLFNSSSFVWIAGIDRDTSAFAIFSGVNSSNTGDYILNSGTSSFAHYKALSHRFKLPTDNIDSTRFSIRIVPSGGRTAILGESSLPYENDTLIYTGPYGANYGLHFYLNNIYVKSNFFVDSTLNVSDNSIVYINKYDKVIDNINSIGSNQGKIIITDTITIDSNITIPANITLSVQGRGFLNGDSTLTIGMFENENNKHCFDTSLSVVFDSVSVEYVNAKWFGCIGDSIGDDTKALQNTISSGANKIVIPVTNKTYRITDEITVGSNVEIEGYGTPRIKQETQNKRIFTANSESYIKISDIHFMGCSDTPSGSTTNQVSVYMIGCSHSKIYKCVFSENAGPSILLSSCNDCEIYRNTFTNSGNIRDDDKTNDYCNDIILWYACNRNTVSYNNINSGSMTGIIIQTISDGFISSDNIISNNIVENCNRYGIILYNDRSTDPTSEILNTQITNNTLREIACSTSTAGDRQFGAGIYVLSSENTLVDANVLERTNINTDNNTLAPGAVGVSGTSVCKISNNIIIDPQYYGIYIVESLEFGDGTGTNPNFEPEGFATIVNNEIMNSTQDGILVKNKHNVNIAGNTIRNAGGSYGISIQASAAYDTIRKISIVNNTIDSANVVSIGVSMCKHPLVSLNRITNGQDAGIFIDSCWNAELHSNVLTYNETGIDIRSNSSDTRLVGNVVFESVNNGVVGSSNWCGFHNTSTGNGNDYAGAFDQVACHTDESFFAYGNNYLSYSGEQNGISFDDTGSIRITVDSIPVIADDSVTSTDKGLRLYSLAQTDSGDGAPALTFGTTSGRSGIMGFVDGNDLSEMGLIGFTHFSATGADPSVISWLCRKNGDFYFIRNAFCNLNLTITDTIFADVGDFNFVDAGVVTATDIIADNGTIDTVNSEYVVVKSGTDSSEILPDTIKTTGMLKQKETWHAVGGFFDSSVTITISVADTWYQITNGIGDLWTGREADGITISGDTMIIANAGDYRGTVSLCYSALTGQDYSVRVYNITQAFEEVRMNGPSTTGANNKVCVTLPIYIEASANDRLVFQIENNGATQNVTMHSSEFELSYLHD